MFTTIAKFYDKFTKYAVMLAPVVLLIIRLAWGWELFESGRSHLMNVEKTTEFFQSLNIPMPHASVIISGTTEMVGGICWMLGLFTRLISIPLFFNFCVAYLTASRPAVVGIFHDPDTFINDSVSISDLQPPISSLWPWRDLRRSPVAGDFPPR